MANEKKIIRVLFYVAELPPYGGGVATSAENILSRIRVSDGVRVDVITLSVDGKYKSYDLNEMVRVYELPASKVSEKEIHNQKISRVLWYLLVSYFFSWVMVFKNKYNLSCFFGYPGGIVGVLFCWRLPYVVSLQGLETPGYNPKFRNWYRVYKWFARIVFGGSKMVIACSEDLASLAKKTDKKIDVEVISTGVDLGKIKVYRENEKYKKFTVTAGGTRMGSIKRLEDLVLGFAKFSKVFDDVVLVLYGSGEKKSDLVRLVNELRIKTKVVFVGNVSREYLYKNLGKCHVMVLPSLNEGMSNAVLGAMAASLPIIMTRVGGYKELIERNGCLVEKEAPDQICDALIKIYKNKKLRLEMGKMSRKIAEKYDWEIITDKYVKAFEKAG